MEQPNREPDFTWNKHIFWCVPEMVTYNGVTEKYEVLIEVAGLLCYNWHKGLNLRREIQELYATYIMEKELLS